MAFVVLGAGAIGAVVGARLHRAGHAVTPLARGAHLETLRAHGLRLESPDGAEILTVPAVGDPGEIRWREDHVVLLAVKSQHTEAALGALAVAAPSRTPIVLLGPPARDRHACERADPATGPRVRRRLSRPVQHVRLSDVLDRLERAS